MTYGGPLTSISQNAPIMPRVQAMASRRALVTSASLSRDRSRTTFDVASYSSNTSISLARNSRRFFGGRQARCARINAPIIVNSTDGEGISSAVEGGNSTRPGILTPHNAAPRSLAISDRVKTGNSKAGLAHGKAYPHDEWLIRSRGYSPVYRAQPSSRMGAAVGPADERRPPRSRIAGPPHCGKTGVSSPSPLHQLLNHCGLLQSPPRHAEGRPSQIRAVDCEAHVALRRQQVFPTSDLGPVAKPNLDQLAHRLVSKSAGTRLAPLGVFQ